MYRVLKVLSIVPYIPMFLEFFFTSYQTISHYSNPLLTVLCIDFCSNCYILYVSSLEPTYLSEFSSNVLSSRKSSDTQSQKNSDFPVLLGDLNKLCVHLALEKPSPRLELDPRDIPCTEGACQEECHRPGKKSFFLRNLFTILY